VTQICRFGVQFSRDHHVAVSGEFSSLTTTHLVRLHGKCCNLAAPRSLWRAIGTRENLLLDYK
jgi:hypothetical protein